MSLYEPGSQPFGHDAQKIEMVNFSIPVKIDSLITKRLQLEMTQSQALHLGFRVKIIHS